MISAEVNIVFEACSNLFILTKIIKTQKLKMRFKALKELNQMKDLED